MFQQNVIIREYLFVIDDVMREVRPIFADEGIDEQILTHLKQSWTAKMLGNKAVSESSVLDINLERRNEDSVSNATAEDKRIPLKVVIESHAFNLNVPPACLEDNELKRILSGPAMSAIIKLPHLCAESLLQQYVNNALVQNRRAKIQKENSTQVEETLKSTSQEESMPVQVKCSNQNSTETKLENREKNVEMNLDESLNSDDDLTEDETPDTFGTENVIVCQFDKVGRNQKKWTLSLKHGVMHLDGRDYLFQAAKGDAEW